MPISRRRFLGAALPAAAGLTLAGRAPFGGAAFAQSRLSRRFPDLARHFVFEYYAWYSLNPIDHWDQDDRRPPVDLASNFMPRLGAYDSKSTRVMEQHARWIRDAGVGAINLSWWGPGSSVDQLVPTLMDVMAAHDIKVAFHLEPYRDHHALYYAENVEYLIRQYGDRRRWDAMLLLRDERGERGPVFKSFRTILPPTTTDCHGREWEVRDYADDGTWRQQTDRVRATFGKDFDHVTLLADSLNWDRTKRSGFDGVAIYDAYVRPDTWREYAAECSREDLLFTFGVNPGFDAIARRRVEPDSCYAAPEPEPKPASPYVWTRPADVAAAAAASEQRINQSFDTTVALQTDPASSNARRGFFLVYITSFNEWHEGHQFEPMKNRGQMSPQERAIGYHNPDDGESRLKALKRRLQSV